MKPKSATRLERYLAETAMTPDDLAYRLKLPRATVCRWLSEGVPAKSVRYVAQVLRLRDSEISDEDRGRSDLK